MQKQVTYNLPSFIDLIITRVHKRLAKCAVDVYVICKFKCGLEGDTSDGQCSQLACKHDDL